MMNIRLSFVCTLAILMMAISGAGSATDSAGAEDAKSLLSKAVSYMEQEGSAKAFCAFNSPTGPFHQGPLYVFAINMDGIYFAHGAAPTLVGTSLRDLRDAAGRPFGKNIMEVITTQGEGTVDYKWLNYTSNKVEDKHSFVKKVGVFVLGVGYYTR